MNARRPSRTERWVVAGAVAGSLLPAAAQGAVGRVVFASGDAVRVDAQGKEQRLTRGTQLEQGDTVRTAVGRAQIRFTDGAFTSVLPNSEFRIDEYGYQQEKEEESKGFFSLLKGGLRTITGVIGKLRRDAYRVRTPVATIGIRGTEYVAVLGNSLTVWVGDGRVATCNQAGCTNADAGGQIYVRNENTKGIIVDEKPDTSDGEVATTTYSGAEETTDDGTPAITTTTQGFESGPFYALAIAVGESSEGGAVQQYPNGAGLALTDVTFGDGAGMTAFQGQTAGGPTGGSIGSAQLTEVGSDDTDVLFWGRWVNGTIELTGNSEFFPGSHNLSGSETLAFAGGLPTTDMPTSGTATLNLIGGTSPAYADGSGTGTLNSGSLVANFGTSAVDVNLNFSIGGHTFNVDSGPGGAVSIGAGGLPAFAFSGDGTFTSSAACSSGCSTSVEGFFAGSGASRAGMTYKVFDESTFEYAIGSAGFAR